MESARLKLHATGFFGLFLTRSRGGDSRRTACASKPTRDFFEMALKLVIGNKNYSSWSMRPWLALRTNNIPFDEVFIPLYTGEADKKTDFEFHTFRQGAGADRWRRHRLGFTGHHRIRCRTVSADQAMAGGPGTPGACAFDFCGDAFRLCGAAQRMRHEP